MPTTWPVRGMHGCEGGNAHLCWGHGERGTDKHSSRSTHGTLAKGITKVAALQEASDLSITRPDMPLGLSPPKEVLASPISL